MGNLKNKIITASLLISLPIISGCNPFSFVKESAISINTYFKENSIKNKEINNLPIYNETRDFSAEKILDPLVEKHDNLLREARNSLNKSLEDRTLKDNEIEDILKDYQSVITNSRDSKRAAKNFGKYEEYSSLISVPEDEIRLYDLMILGNSKEIQRAIVKNGLNVEVEKKSPYLKYLHPLSKKILEE